MDQTFILVAPRQYLHVISFKKGATTYFKKKKKNIIFGQEMGFQSLSIYM